MLQTDHHCTTQITVTMCNEFAILSLKLLLWKRRPDMQPLAVSRL